MHDEQSSCDTQLIRQVTEMGVRLDMVLEARKADGTTLKDIFDRIGALEKRMAQIVLIGFLVTLLAPAAWAVGTVWIESHHPQGQQAKQL